MYESLLKWEDVKPELVLWARPQARQEEDKWDGEEEFMGDDGVGLVERLMGLFLEQEKIKFGDMLLGLLWNERNAGSEFPKLFFVGFSVLTYLGFMISCKY